VTAPTSAVVFAVVLPGLLVAHSVADHWVQSSPQAAMKGTPGWPGRLACARHVASYTAVTAGVVLALVVVLDLGVNPWWVAAGQLVSAASHYWADRRTTLRRLAGRAGKAGFYTLGAPRPDRDDNPCLGTGAYALDLSWHHGWLLVAALLTTVGAS
jgi:hypothetical protein